MVCGLAANGYGISTYRLLHARNLPSLALVATAVITYVVFVALYAAGGGTAGRSGGAGLASTPAAVVLLLTTALFAGWFAWRARATILGETHVVKRVVIWRVCLALGSTLAILPAAEAVGAMTPAYERLRVSIGFELFFNAVSGACVVWCLWPSRCADAFKVYDGSANLLGDAEGTPDFAAALDEAYAYTAVASGGGGSGGGATPSLAGAPPLAVATYGRADDGPLLYSGSI